MSSQNDLYAGILDASLTLSDTSEVIGARLTKPSHQRLLASP